MSKKTGVLLRDFLPLSKFVLLLLAVWGLCREPAQATTYGWNGLASTNWTDAGSWGASGVAPTGGTFDAVITVTNKANSALYYTAANGSTLLTNISSEGSGRALRIGDLSAGTLIITGGTLESHGTGGDLIGNGAAGNGTLIVDGGVYISTNNTILFGNTAGGSATFTVNSGTATVAIVQGANATSGLVNLNGGLLTLKQLTLNGSELLTVNLSGGTLQAYAATGAWLVSTDATYNLTGNINLDSQAFNLTNSAALNGAGTVTKVGTGLLALQGNNTMAAVTNNAGTLALGGVNTISGGVFLNAGTLNINNAGALGTNALTIYGGAINNATAAAITNSNNNAQNWNADFTFAGTAGLNLGAGLVTMSSNRTVTVNGNTLTVGGTLTGFVNSASLNALDITKAGGGNLTLTADITTLRAGQTNIVNAGTENITGAISGSGLNALDVVKAGAGNVNLSTPITLYANQTNASVAGTTIYSGSIDDGGNNFGLTFKGAGAATLAANNTFGGGLTVLANMTVKLSGSNSYGGVSLATGGSALLQVGNNNALGNTSGVTIATNAGVVQLLNGVTVTGETILISGNGDNFGALQAGAASTSTWAGPVFLSDNVGTDSPRLGAPSTGVLTVSGPIANGTAGTILYISGASGAGKVILSGTNTYTGLTGLVRGWLVLGADNTLPTNTTLNLNVANITTDSSTFDLNGHNQTIAQLVSVTTNTQPILITNTAGSLATLTINQNVNSAFGGGVGGNLGLTKGGTGALALTSSNLTYSGTTTINAGTLLLGVTNNNTTIVATSNLAALGPAYPLDQPFVDWTASKVSGTLPVLAMGSNSANSVVFSGALAGTFLGGAGTVTNTGGAVWGDTTVRLGGGSGTLVYTPSIGNGTNVVIGPVGGNSASVVLLLGSNSYTSTTIQSGTLQITNDVSLGAQPGAFMATNLVINGGTLLGPGADISVVANRGVAVGTNGAIFSIAGAGVLRIQGVVSDLPGQAGFITVTNSGQLVFSGNNTYSGGTLIPTGANLVIQGNSALGVGIVTLNGGLLRATSTAVGTTFVSNNIVVSANSSLGGSNAKNLTFLGNVTLVGGTRTLAGGSTDSATFNGVIGDGGNGYGLVKTGAGTFTFANVNTYGGGTIVNGGVLALTTNYAPGTGAITLSNATLRTTTGSGWALSNSINIAAASTNFFDTGSDMILTNGANLTGAGMVVKTSGNLLQLWGNNGAFSGTFVNSNSGTWFNQASSGSPNANWVLASGTLAFNNDNGGIGQTIQLGSFAGAAGTVLRSGGTQAGITTFAVGALGSNTTYNGQITDGVNNTIKTALAKIGPGTLTLSGANTFTGGTAINAGTLALTGSGTLGSNSINVASGATLDTTGLTAGGLALLSAQNLTNSGTVAGGLIINSGAFATGGGTYGNVTNLSGGLFSPGVGGHTNFIQTLTLADSSTNRFFIGSPALHDMSVISNSLNLLSGVPLLQLDLRAYSSVGGINIVLYDDVFSGLSGFDGTNTFLQLSDVLSPDNNLILSNGVPFAAVGGGSTTNFFTIRYDFNADGDGMNNDIVLTVIPEPTTLNLLVVLGAAFALRRHGPRHRHV
jgi:autotransporter-associated beta strand protein